MDKKAGLDVVKKNKFAQLQVGYMYYLGLIQNKAFKYQVENNMGLALDKLTIVFVRKLLNKDNSHVLSLIMFYDNRKTIIFKVLGSVIIISRKTNFC